MRSQVINIILLLILLSPARRAKASVLAPNKQNVVHSLLDKAFAQLALQRRLFRDRYVNGTQGPPRNYDFYNKPVIKYAEEGRGKKKKLKQMNRVLLAIVMAYTLKFLFLIPSFIGTLILFKFTTTLVGFFYALFAAVLGLEHRHH